MTGDPASTLYDYADSISLDAQFHLVDTISGTDLNQTKIIDLCESAAASATCAIGDGATTSELKLLQLLDRTDTIRGDPLLDASEIQDAGAGSGVTVSHANKVEIVARSVAILEEGQTLDELAANVTAENELKITQLRDNTLLEAAYDALVSSRVITKVVAVHNELAPRRSG